MITQISGKLVEKNPTYAIVDCNGVGYLLHISLNTFSSLPDRGGRALVYPSYSYEKTPTPCLVLSIKQKEKFLGF